MINPYINYPLDNSRKVAPVATSVAPVVAGHCTPMFALIKFPYLPQYNCIHSIYDRFGHVSFISHIPLTVAFTFAENSVPPPRNISVESLI